MNSLMIGIAAMVIAAPVLAQSSGTANPAPLPGAMADPMTAPATPPANDMGTPPVATTAPDSAAADASMLTQKNGKWWKGERRATEAEIAEYRRSEPR